MELLECMVLYKDNCNLSCAALHKGIYSFIPLVRRVHNMVMYLTPNRANLVFKLMIMYYGLEDTKNKELLHAMLAELYGEMLNYNCEIKI